ncbi:hypothetical protein B296_00005636 [Ensete ventricosum]|uniref:Uncharacterized protein n=1 Tax=Ensete ventricosum TaxID=4639 RepID=A0A426YGZ6_ENSVE|nr:hypothetical protein B296_00005636 [Ensete ventricosum]
MNTSKIDYLVLLTLVEVFYLVAQSLLAVAKSGVACPYDNPGRSNVGLAFASGVLIDSSHLIRKSVAARATQQRVSQVRGAVGCFFPYSDSGVRKMEYTIAELICDNK